ncbi:thioesterase family protein [Brevibacillus sp. NRS-1366]|uniref:thioesterase family protein n=1 Tax=Brevibacillus sp. NRS-1366 TaxID=3233899 RepID=UPI003D1E5F08
MFQSDNPLYKDHVHSGWVDYNGHMNDAQYARVFSIAAEHLIENIGISSRFREENAYSIYTLDVHICYLAEVYEGQAFRVTAQLLDHDSKRMHLFFVMENDEGKRLATCEQMLMGIDMNERRSAPFPAEVKERIEGIAQEHEQLPIPADAGRKIGIRKGAHFT